MWEFTEHTADVGIRVRAASRAELYIEAAHALNALMVEHPEAVRPLVEHTLRVKGDDEIDLLHDWLEELLFHFSARRMIFVHFQLTLEDNEIVATARGESLDPDRHPPNLDIKAITYHQLHIENEHGEWLAEVIVDI